MSRTFRRKNQQHEYLWVLKDWELCLRGGPSIGHDPRSLIGRKAISIFHSDKNVTMGDSAERWYRKKYDHQRRTRNNRVMKQWMDGRDFDPIFEERHKHEANHSWW